MGFEFWNGSTLFHRLYTTAIVFKWLIAPSLLALTHCILFVQSHLHPTVKSQSAQQAVHRVSFLPLPPPPQIIAYHLQRETSLARVFKLASACQLDFYCQLFKLCSTHHCIELYYGTTIGKIPHLAEAFCCAQLAVYSEYSAIPVSQPE